MVQILMQTGNQMRKPPSRIFKNDLQFEMQSHEFLVISPKGDFSQNVTKDMKILIFGYLMGLVKGVRN